jgi:hypothetical protein
MTISQTSGTKRLIAECRRVPIEHLPTAAHRTAGRPDLSDVPRPDRLVEPPPLPLKLLPELVADEELEPPDAPLVLVPAGRLIDAFDDRLDRIMLVTGDCHSLLSVRQTDRSRVTA